MKFRADVVLVLVALLALAHLFASSTAGPRLSDATALLTTGGLPRSVAAQEDNEDNEDDDNDDEDNDDEDNDDGDNDDNDNGDEDNDDGDNDEDNDDGDNDEDNDDEDNDDLDEVDPWENADNVVPAGGTPPATGAAAAPAAPAPSPAVPVTEVSGVTTGADATIAFPDGRITVKVFATMPAGVTLTVRMVDPLAYTAVPGIRAGNLIFEVSAVDATGAVLSTLPAEVNLSVVYLDTDVTGLNEPAITMGRLDPLDNQWKPAPKLLAAPESNYIAASIMDTGTYAVYVP